ncbi:MAG: glycosyltransferase [Acidobacteriaceae bacterium]|nr:glycosyltransferase [Acidobacteriaceae bacterium]
MLLAACVLLGCWVYCMLAIAAAMRHARAQCPFICSESIRISILKPLAGLDEGLEENLRSFFEQDYAQYELLFAVRHEWDPAVEVVRRLALEFPGVRSKLLFTGEPPYPHAKVFSLQCMLEHSQNELVVMSDSDVRVGKDFCSSLAAEFSDHRLGLVTCPYRAVAGSAFWSKLEAVGMNTDFHAGLFTAVMMEGTRFAVGPTIVARKHVLTALGGIERVKDYLSSEDFMLGRIAAELGFVVRLSSYVVEHRIGSESMAKNFEHRLRWARTTRRSRPWGYVGQFFTHALPVGLLTCVMVPRCWPVLIVTVLLRAVSAWMVSVRVLSAGVPWMLLPLQDAVGFAFWMAGFFGRSISWRGQRYTLNRDGTVQMAG